MRSFELLKTPVISRTRSDRAPVSRFRVSRSPVSRSPVSRSPVSRSRADRFCVCRFFLRFCVALLLLMPTLSERAEAQGGADFPSPSGNERSGICFHVLNGVSHDITTLTIGAIPTVEENRPGTGVFGLPGNVRVRDGQILVPVSVPDSSPPSLFGGFTSVDQETGMPRAFRNLHGFTHNPVDVAWDDRGHLYLSNLRAFDSQDLDYRLTVLDDRFLLPLQQIALPNPFAAEADPSLSPSGLLRVGDVLFICCTGFSFTTFDYANPGTIAVFNLANGRFVDTDGDAGNGVTPLFTAIPNPGSALLGPDGDIYVLCSGNFGAFSGAPHISGGVEVFAFPSLTHRTTIDFGGEAAPTTLRMTPDGRAYAGDGISPWVYSVDLLQDEAIRDWNDPVRLPQFGPFGWAVDFAFLDDGTVLAIDFNEAWVYAWNLGDDLGSGDPGVYPLADLNPGGQGFPGPQWFVPASSK